MLAFEIDHLEAHAGSVSEALAGFGEHLGGNIDQRELHIREGFSHQRRNESCARAEIEQTETRVTRIGDQRERCAVKLVKAGNQLPTIAIIISGGVVKDLLHIDSHKALLKVSE